MNPAHMYIHTCRKTNSYSAPSQQYVGVNIRLFPTTGMTLPFISYGGSSIISISIISGIILNLTKRKIN